MEIQGPRLILKTLGAEHVNDTYLGWLNDSEVQNFTRRRKTVTTMEDLRQFVKACENSKDVFFAIFIAESHQHIGNIFLRSVDEMNKCADLTIMLGDKTSHGKGYAQEAIEILTDYAFTQLGLHRLYACSPNPAFNKMIQKLGWLHEGTRRDAFNIDGKFVDMECWAIINNR